MSGIFFVQLCVCVCQVGAYELTLMTSDCPDASCRSVRGCRVGCPEGADWMAPPASYRSTPLLAVYLAMRFFRPSWSRVCEDVWRVDSFIWWIMTSFHQWKVARNVSFSSAKRTKMYAADERICMKILPRVEDCAVDSASKFQFHQPIRSRVMKFQSWSVQILFQSDVHVQISCEPTIHRAVLKLTTQLDTAACQPCQVFPPHLHAH